MNIDDIRCSVLILVGDLIVDLFLGHRHFEMSVGSFGEVDTEQLRWKWLTARVSGHRRDNLRDLWDSTSMRPAVGFLNIL